MKKLKLSIDEQITYMKEKMGVQFNIVDEASAKKFLSYNNYYFRVKSFAKNYEKYRHGEKIGKYVNLEFAYLQELSTLDMYFRRFIMQITLDIEHTLKTSLLFDCSNNPNEDGYSIVEIFLKQNHDVKRKIAGKRKNSAISNLINKYSESFAIWNIVEVLTFGDFIKLYDLYYKLYPKELLFPEAIWSAKLLRNAAAHNTCILNSIKIPYRYNNQSFSPNQSIAREVSKISRIERKLRNSKLNNPIIYDFVATLILFDRITTSHKIKLKTFADLHHFINFRCMKNNKYFQKNEEIKSAFRFIKFLIDDLYRRLL